MFHVDAALQLERTHVVSMFPAFATELELKPKAAIPRPQPISPTLPRKSAIYRLDTPPSLIPSPTHSILDNSPTSRKQTKSTPTPLQRRGSTSLLDRSSPHHSIPASPSRAHAHAPATKPIPTPEHTNPIRTIPQPLPRRSSTSDLFRRPTYKSVPSIRAQSPLLYESDDDLSGLPYRSTPEPPLLLFANEERGYSREEGNFIKNNGRVANSTSSIRSLPVVPAASGTAFEAFKAQIARSKGQTAASLSRPGSALSNRDSRRSTITMYPYTTQPAPNSYVSLSKGRASPFQLSSQISSTSSTYQSGTRPRPQTPVDYPTTLNPRPKAPLRSNTPNLRSNTPSSSVPGAPASTPPAIRPSPEYSPAVQAEISKGLSEITNSRSSSKDSKMSWKSESSRMSRGSQMSSVRGVSPCRASPREGYNTAGHTGYGVLTYASRSGGSQGNIGGERWRG
ncbi:hypothetical protein P7C70_g4271, partial [Phenoliferia sp. Uapishka_3]